MTVDGPRRSMRRRRIGDRPRPGASRRRTPFAGVATTALATTALATASLVVLTAASAPAGATTGTVAASTFAVQPSPDPVLPDLTMTGVACTAPTACVAVGSSFGATGQQQTLAETLEGRRWTVVPTPFPSGAIYSVLSGVSCTAADACTAVGSWVDAAGAQAPLAESFDGTSWTIETTPAPAGSDAELLAVSCSAGGPCTAVGRYLATTGRQQALAESFDGSSWNLVTTPDPSKGFQSAELEGVSCTAAAACEAVGDDVNRNGDQLALAEGLDGTAWTVQATVRPGGASGVQLFGVSCPMAGACEAVGDDVRSTGGEVPLVEAWNGTTWSKQATPEPSSAVIAGLAGLSCTAATSCEAVGDQDTGAGAELPLAETFGGSAWAVQHTPDPFGSAVASLDAVSCEAGTAPTCTAVGDYVDADQDDETAAEDFDGTAWKVQATANPDGATDSLLSGVSCPAAGACVAVGGFGGVTDTLHTLAETWEGSAWAIAATPDVPGDSENQLADVSCSSPDACTAVGGALSGTGWAPVAEGFDGTSWTLETTAHLSATTQGYLDGVSCTGSSTCTAVGYTVHDGVTKALVETFDGTAWSIAAAPEPAGAEYGSLADVSCTADGSCTAVGTYETNARELLPLAEVWSGTAWSPATPPLAAGDVSGALNALSCTAADACTAVGEETAKTATADKALAESFDGTTWTVETAAQPAGTDVALEGVSCVSVGGCVAVGGYHRASGDASLAESTDGTAWTIQTVDAPPGSTSGLAGVACAAAEVCTAVGSSSTTYSSTLVVAEGGS